MELNQNVTREFLAAEAQKIIDFGNRNLEQISAKCQKQETTQDYYLGIMRRQVIILYDLQTLLKGSPHTNFTSLFILSRCLLDDFLFLFFLKTHDDEEENIVRINANGYGKSFQALEIIMESNHRHFNGAYPFYLTKDELEKIKSIFKSKPNNDKYFKKKDHFTFKSFMQLTQVADKIEDFELSKLSLRVHFLWKEFSTYVHYTNLTFESEINVDDDITNLLKIEEVLLYVFNSIELAFRFFSERNGLKLLVDAELEDRYMITYK